MSRLAIVLAAALAAAPVTAAEVIDVTVTHEDGVYHVAIEAWLDAPMPAVYAVLTDYPQWAVVNDLIKESEVLDASDPTRTLVRTVAEGCVLFFCKRFTQVQWMHADGEDGIRAEVIPERSDLRSGSAHTVLTDADGRTLFDYEMSLEPDFWIPPFVGPLVLKRKLRKQAVETAEAVETAATAR